MTRRDFNKVMSAVALGLATGARAYARPDDAKGDKKADKAHLQGRNEPRPGWLQDRRRWLRREKHLQGQGGCACAPSRVRGKNECKGQVAAHQGSRLSARTPGRRRRPLKHTIK
jgi:hypothetical protein